MSNGTAPLVPPGPDPCWAGSWSSSDPQTDLWTQAAMARTVSALPRLHSWRLADTKAASRVVLWLGQPATREEVVTLTRTSKDPHLRTGDVDGLDEETLWSVVEATTEQMSTRRASDVAPDLVQNDDSDEPLWLGALAAISASWLPPLVILPRSERELDDPGTD